MMAEKHIDLKCSARRRPARSSPGCRRSTTTMRDGRCPRPSSSRGCRARTGLICHITDRSTTRCWPRCPELRVVANVAVGYNNIDVAAARRRGVVVTNTPDVLTETTADFAWALLMAAARRVVEADRYVRSGQWTALGVGHAAGAATSTARRSAWSASAASAARWRGARSASACACSTTTPSAPTPPSSAS